jgi:hypothetical protein
MAVLGPLVNYGWWTVLTLLAVIPGIFCIRSVFRDVGVALNDTLAATGRLLVLKAMLFSIGWLI